MGKGNSWIEDAKDRTASLPDLQHLLLMSQGLLKSVGGDFRLRKLLSRGKLSRYMEKVHETSSDRGTMFCCM